MEEELKKRFERLGEQILIASRNEIYLSMRFFGTALHYLSYDLSLLTQTIGMDGEKIYYNPKHLLELYDKGLANVNHVYLHMLLHGLFRHLFKNIEEKEGEYTNWDLACDIAVESMIDSFEDISCILSNLSAYREEIYQRLKKKLSVLTAEGIYQQLPIIAASQVEFEQLRKEFSIDDHSFWKKKKKEKESNQQKEKQKQIWKEIAKKTQTAMETFYRQAGDQSRNLKQMLKIQNRKREDYAKFLRQFAVIKEEISLDLDSFDYIFYCFGLNGYEKGIINKKVPLIEPLEYKERYGIDEFAIAIDTSGSISQKQIQEFLLKTVNILQSEETFFRKIQVHILQCDVKVQRDLVIRSKKDLEKIINGIEISGFGGTDFRAIFSYLEELLENGTLTRLRGLLYFTDGIGTYPEKMPSFETAFILPIDSKAEFVPSWAMKVFIDFNKELIN